jgi:hypothetical protein
LDRQRKKKLPIGFVFTVGGTGIGEEDMTVETDSATFYKPILPTGPEAGRAGADLLRAEKELRGGSR